MMDYKKAGVDIEAGYKSVELMKEHVKKTMRAEVLGGLGGFSGAFSLAKIKEMAEPKFQSPLVKNCVSMTLPTSTYCPPPRSFGIKKLDTAGRNTSVIPLSTPGRERGSVTFRKLCMGVAPRSLAASSRLLSIFAREE